MDKKQHATSTRLRPNIRYYINCPPGAEGEKPDDRLWIISVPAPQMKQLKRAAEAKGVWLRQVSRSKLKSPNIKRRIVIDGQWSDSRADLVFHVSAPGPFPWRSEQQAVA